MKQNNVIVRSIGDADKYGIKENDIINRDLLLLVISQLKRESKILPTYAKVEGNKTRDKMIKGAQNATETSLKDRRETGALTSETDFLAGAVSALQYIDVHQFGADPDNLKTLPPKWFFGALRGESIIDQKPTALKVLIEVDKEGHVWDSKTNSNIDVTIIDDNMINALNDPEHAECMAEERAQLKQEIQKARGW